MNNIQKFALLAALGFPLVAGAQTQQPADSAAQNNSQPSAVGTADRPVQTTNKPKKVWTDDDLHKLGGVSPVGDGKNAVKTKYASGKSSTDSAAANYKIQLVKLQGQLDETNKKLLELQNFNGQNSPDTAIQTNHRLNRASVSDQIAQLEAKKKQFETQIQNIYDQARHSGIEPGALR
jgi:hypothetical protein